MKPDVIRAIGSLSIFSTISETISNLPKDISLKNNESV